MRVPHGIPTRECGVMLIEALIAILIFSIGILAVVGMQGVAIKNVNESKYRSEAAFLAQELLAQMWVDQNINPGTKMNTSNVNVDNYDYAGTGTPKPRLRDWVAKIQTTLPGIDIPTNLNLPKVTITNESTSGATVKIEIFWRLPEEASQGLPPHSHTLIASVQV